MARVLMRLRTEADLSGLDKNNFYLLLYIFIYFNTKYIHYSEVY